MDKLQVTIEPAVRALGYNLWGCAWTSDGKGRRLLRVYVDGPDGVNLDDCAKMSRQISAVLDVDDSIGGRYTLEVSSPGLERPLFTVDQCRDYMGQTIAIRLHIPKDGRRKFSGVLADIENEQIRLKLEDDTELTVVWQDVDKAHLVMNAVR